MTDERSEDEQRSAAAAMEIAAFLIEFFQIPENVVTYVKLVPGDLKPGDEEQPFGSVPRMTPGHESQWHVGIRMQFGPESRTGVEDVTIAMGIRPLAKGYSLQAESRFLIEGREDLLRYARYLQDDLRWS